MAYEFKLPDIGEGVVEGEIVRWLVKEGDTLAQDQPMVEIMTDKATVEIPAPRPGKVLQRMFGEGDVCPVGKVLIRIEESGSAAATSGPTTAEPATERRPRRGSSNGTPARGAADTTARTVLATPATRKLARELGIDLAAVAATGKSGRITSDDVRASAGGSTGTTGGTVARALSARPVSPSQGDVRVPFRGLRRKIAEHMTLAKHKAAHFTYVEEVDATNLVNLREKANARLTRQGLKISYLPFFIKAAVDALRRFPQLNAYLDETTNEIVQRGEYHIGVASATDEGLVVPVVKHADQRSLVDLAHEVERLAQATKAGRASRDDLSGSTFTITSLGTLGGVLATPIINFPEVAILGIHKIARRPVAFEDKIEIRHMMNLSLSVDHRLVDGHEAAAFAAAIKESLETPGLLFLESV